jgi:hypothetical protein
MFIPNKTFNAMRLGVVGIIAILTLVIAGESVLFIKMQQDNKVVLDSLTTRIDEVSKESNSDYRNVSGQQDGTSELLYETIAKVDAQAATITQLQEFTTRTQISVDKLLRNECTPETAIYVLTKDMAAVCRTLGVIP